MNGTVQFDAATEAVIARVRKLLALADNNDNEHQAEAAANKARELLEAHNLELAHVSRDTNQFAPRDQRKTGGGLYKWQRELWDGVARLNFCRYWFIRGLAKGSAYEHELLGSKVNVISTTLMAQYLQDTVERLAREWCNENHPGKSIFIKPAIAYREGMAERLTYRMWELREKRLKEEEARVKAERDANAARGIFTENAIVLSDVISNEEDLNTDHVNGWPAGTSARKRKERDIRMEKADREAAELLRQQEEWDAAHPVEAAARKAKEAAERKARSDEFWAKQEKRRPRKQTPEQERRGMREFSAGYRKGDEISLDKQVGGTNNGRLLE